MWQRIRARFEGRRRSRIAAILGVVAGSVVFGEAVATDVGGYSAFLMALLATLGTAAVSSFLLGLWHGREVEEAMVGTEGVTGKLGQVANATEEPIDLLDTRLTEQMDAVNVRLASVEAAVQELRGSTHGADTERVDSAPHHGTEDEHEAG